MTKHCSSCSGRSNCSDTLGWVGGPQASCINSELQPLEYGYWVIRFNHPLSANHNCSGGFIQVIAIKETTLAISLLQLIQRGKHIMLGYAICETVTKLSEGIGLKTTCQIRIRQTGSGCYGAIPATGWECHLCWVAGNTAIPSGM